MQIYKYLFKYKSFCKNYVLKGMTQTDIDLSI